MRVRARVRRMPPGPPIWIVMAAAGRKTHVTPQSRQPVLRHVPQDVTHRIFRRAPKVTQSCPTSPNSCSGSRASAQARPLLAGIAHFADVGPL